MSDPGERSMKSIALPEGKRFAFTIFDDTDSATLENVRDAYALLADLGFRTTKSCWVVEGDRRQGKFPGDTCDRPEYLQWLRELQGRGFEIAWHGPSWHGLPREQTIAALEKFCHLLGHYPKTAANHTGSPVGVYWAESRLSGILSSLYSLVTLGRNQGMYRGHVPGNPNFWGDVCKERITYYRNFVFQDVNTLKACPFMPYHDPNRPLVNYWFASSNGRDVETFNRCLSEANQDRLERRGASASCMPISPSVSAKAAGRIRGSKPSCGGWPEKTAGSCRYARCSTTFANPAASTRLPTPSGAVWNENGSLKKSASGRFRIGQEIRVAFRSAKVALLSRSERRLCDSY